MKKYLILLIILFSKSILIYPCTNFLISRGASTDSSTMITYAADSHVLYGELYFRPAQDYPENTLLDIYEWDTGKYLGKIKQARHTYSVVGNINEHQVAIGETTYGGKTELQDTTGIIDYGSLMYITLQRARTAREAIQVINDLLSEYGYYSSGESFSISDPEEVWIMEIIGKGTKLEPVGKGKNKKIVNVNKGAVWVARRIPDGYISGHANQARITTFPQDDPENCLYASDVISFAKEMGYYKGEDKDFSFADTYAPLDFGAARFCEARVWSGFRKVNKNMDQYLDYAKGENLENRMPLWVKPDKKLSVRDVMGLMRDYFQGTELDMTQDFGAGPYECIVRWRPLTWEVDGKTFFNERAISTQQTGFSFVAQSRLGLPDPIGGILWFGADDTYSTVYTPMYCGMQNIPRSFAVGTGSMMEFDSDAAFWVFNQVSNFAYTRYSLMIPEIQSKQSQLEKNFIQTIPAIDQTALELYKNDKNQALNFITSYSVSAGEYTVTEWKKLYRHLFTRYMDGNVKEKVDGEQNPKYTQPGYSETWYRKLIDETGDKFLYHGEESH
ncbi:MAG: C69 family dipeptidase [Bacteroidales bacterium]|nr:C69 family dipeptidase [Bacteroidales bacterium]